MLRASCEVGGLGERCEMVDLRLWIRHPNTGYLQNRRDPACLRQAGGVPVALAGAVGTVVAQPCGRSAVVPWWWLRCASLRKSLYRGTVYRDGKTSFTNRNRNASRKP